MNRNLSQQSRRNFIKSSAALGAISFLPARVALGAKSSSDIGPNDKVNLAIVGIGNRGDKNRSLAARSPHCNVVALCDVDMEGRHTHNARYEHGLTETPPKGKKGTVYPTKARGFTDFRVMFDEMGDEIDAVLISTPDHSHFAVAMLAMSLGKHVYVEKPLTHTFGQAQRLMDMAAKNPQLATQMGNQGHSGANYFQFKAWSEAGLLDDITAITAVMNSERRWHGWGESVTEYPSETMPDHISWDQWQDVVAQSVPYSSKMHPAEWRSWYNNGSGAFGDWGPHILDTPHRFLELGYPNKITAVNRDGVNKAGLVFPQASTIQFDFAARGPGKPACVVTWYDGTKNIPMIDGAYTDSGNPEPAKGPGKYLFGKELAFKGGSHARPLVIIPKDKYMDMRQSLPKFPQKNSDHYENFLLACKGEEETRSHFAVSGALTQVFNLGVIAQRLGGEITFDSQSKQIVGNPAANALLDPAPRKGWVEYYQLSA